MSTKTTSITGEAYERLKALRNDEKTSFSEVIVQEYPEKRARAVLPFPSTNGGTRR